MYDEVTGSIHLSEAQSNFDGAGGCAGAEDWSSSISTHHLPRTSTPGSPPRAHESVTLTERHALLRLTFCNEHVNDNIKQWVFADETGFEIDNSNQVY
jgi:hypothetical protein